jgi:hypothetical protein
MACQSFSSATHPTIARTFPTLELMQEKWEKLLESPKHEPMYEGLNRGLDNLRKWYRLGDNTDIYFVSLVLDPGIKMEYFNTHWEKKYVERGKRNLEKIVSLILHFRAHSNILNVTL